MSSVTVTRRLGVAATTVALLALAACSSSTTTSPGATVAPPATTTAPTATTGTTSGGSGAYGDQPAPGGGAATGAATTLATADTSLGTIVVDGDGMTVYQFDKDTQGAGSSTCTGQCATQWPAVHGGAGAPQVDGVTGTVGTITGTDGQPQLTLNGWPLYYYAGDAGPGDVSGQGVGGIWWVLTPAGERVTG